MPLEVLLANPDDEVVNEESEESKNDENEMHDPAMDGIENDLPIGDDNIGGDDDNIGGDDDNISSDDDDDHDFIEAIDIEINDDDENWTEPDYTDQDWFKKNCILCQICDKVYDCPGDALNCFKSHEDWHKAVRCFLCFSVFKGGPGGPRGTKRLYQHYQNRHQKGEQPRTVKCPHCNQSFAFANASCHIISVHFQEALGFPK